MKYRKVYLSKIDYFPKKNIGVVRFTNFEVFDVFQPIISSKKIQIRYANLKREPILLWFRKVGDTSMSLSFSSPLNPVANMTKSVSRGVASASTFSAEAKLGSFLQNDTSLLNSVVEPPGIDDVIKELMPL